MIRHGDTTYPLPEPLPTTTRKGWLNILGVTLHEKPGNWTITLMKLSKAGSRMRILRVFKYILQLF